MTSGRGVVEKRLAAWEAELKTNQYGMAHLAERAIAVLKAELARTASVSTGDGA